MNERIRHSKTRQDLRERLMREYTDRRIEERREANKDEMIPVDQWNGECWKTFFDQFCVPAGEQYGVDPWEYLANFIKHIYTEESNQ